MMSRRRKIDGRRSSLTGSARPNATSPSPWTSPAGKPSMANSFAVFPAVPSVMSERELADLLVVERAALRLTPRRHRLADAPARDRVEDELVRRCLPLGRVDLARLRVYDPAGRGG